MRPDIAALLGATSWRAFDIDDEGRVLAGSDESGSVQLVELAPDGTATALTALPGACSGRYLPGQRVAVVAHDEAGNERGQLSLLGLDPPPDEPVGLDGLTPLVADPDHLHRLLDVLPGRVVYATNRRNGVDFDVVLRAVTGISDTAGAEQVGYDGGGVVQAVAISPDGNHIALTVPGTPALSDQVLLAETGNAWRTELTDAHTPARHLGPRWADGGHLLVSSDAERDLTAVCALGIADGTRRELVSSDTHDLQAWPSPDGQLLLIETNDGGTSRLTLHDGSGGFLRQVGLPGDGVVTWPMPDPVWSPDSRLVALSYTAPDVPGDVLVLEAATGSMRALTASAGQLDGLATPSTRRVDTLDEQRIPCLVYEPTERGSAVAGSAVLVLHGGPESQSRPSFNPVVQALVGSGHTVVLPNVRGSVGYGKRWYSADDRCHRLEAVADLAALHDWLPTIGCDPARAALWGGSYGGYLVLAGLAFQPERWAAGVDIVGISSLISFLENTSDYRRAYREREYGSLDDDRDFLELASPLSRVDSITAPLMVIHGANDPRVPLSEAEQVVDAVRERRVDCELLVYPDEGHGLAHRVNRMHAYPRAVEFLGRHLARP